MIRVDYHVTVPQLQKLKALSKETGAPVSELIRRAIDAYLEAVSQKEKRDAKTA